MVWDSEKSKWNGMRKAQSFLWKWSNLMVWDSENFKWKAQIHPPQSKPEGPDPGPSPWTRSWLRPRHEGGSLHGNPLIDTKVVRGKSGVSRFSARALRCRYKPFDTFVFFLCFWSVLSSTRAFSFFLQLLFLGRKRPQNQTFNTSWLRFFMTMSAYRRWQIVFSKNLILLFGAGKSLQTTVWSNNFQIL